MKQDGSQIADDAGQKDTLINENRKMEMTRVDVVGNKSTSYDLLGSNAKKMEIRSEESNTFVRMYRYVPHTLIFLFFVVLALVFLFAYDFKKTRSEIEALQAQIIVLKNQLEKATTTPPPNIETSVSLENHDEDEMNRTLISLLSRIESIENTQAISLQNTNNSLILLNDKIENAKQEAQSHSMKITTDLESQWKNRVMILEANITELNASLRNLTRTSAKNKETQKLADELTKILSSSTAGGSSNNDLKQLKQDVNALINDVANITAKVDDLKYLRELESKVNSLENDVNKHANELSSLNRNILKMGDDLNRQNDLYGRTNQRVDSLLESFGTQNERIEALSSITTKLLEILKSKSGSS